MTAVELEEVWKTYDRVRWVLQNVSLTVDAGEVVVLMGRSGSGKSTILNLIAGLDAPTRGRVWADEKEISKLDEEARTQLRLHRIGVVFQQYHLIPELTVSENIHLPMKLANRQDGSRTRKLLEFFGLQERADEFPSTLSGGESQRAAIARALANEPVVVLADEPTANLDDENAENALSALRRAADELHTGVLIASHDSMTHGIGDRVIQLDDGMLVSGGATATPTFSRAEARRPRQGRKKPTQD